MHDLRGRWADDAVRRDRASCRGASPPTGGGAWVLERASGRLARLTGLPLPPRRRRARIRARRVPAVSRELPRRPRLRLLDTASLARRRAAVALAAHAQQRPRAAVVGRRRRSAAAPPRREPRDGSTAPLALAGARYAYALAWLDAARIAVRVPGRRDAPAFAVDDGDRRRRCRSARSFRSRADCDRSAVRAPARTARRLSAARDAAPSRCTRCRSPTSRATAARRASSPRRTARPPHRQRQPATVWHRLYAEASLPPGTGFIVRLAATAIPSRRPRRDRVVRRTASAATSRARRRRAGPHVPHAAWERMPSELPAHPGLGPVAARARRRGLFSGADPEFAAARAQPHRPLSVGARRAVRRRPRRSRDRGAARVGAAASRIATTTCRASIARRCSARRPRRPASASTRSTPAHAARSTPAARRRRAARRDARSIGRRSARRAIRVEQPGAAGCCGRRRAGRGWRAAPRERDAIACYRPQRHARRFPRALSRELRRRADAARRPRRRGAPAHRSGRAPGRAASTGSPRGSASPSIPRCPRSGGASGSARARARALARHAARARARARRRHRRRRARRRDRACSKISGCAGCSRRCSASISPTRPIRCCPASPSAATRSSAIR